MSQFIFYPATQSAALKAAAEALKRKGYGVVDRPCESITHLLLPVPSFDADGTIKGGGELSELLTLLPKSITIIGGNLASVAHNKKIDLLTDAPYLCANAYITAHCALRLALMHLPLTARACPTLIIGWGRIGKCLTRLFRALESDLTVAARNPTDRAMACALGYKAIDIPQISQSIDRYRLIINTVPAPVLTREQTLECRQGCLLMDLASTLGIDSPDVLWARGLPGRDAPESSGALIAKSTIRLLSRKDTI